MTIGLGHYLAVGAIMFVIGLIVFLIAVAFVGLGLVYDASFYGVAAVVAAVGFGGAMVGVLALRGHGTTDLAGALGAARLQLARSSAGRKVTILLSDCRATEPGDVVAAAAALDELAIVAPDGDAARHCARPRAAAARRRSGRSSAGRAAARSPGPRRPRRRRPVPPRGGAGGWRSRQPPAGPRR